MIVNSVELKIPYMLLSMAVKRSGEIEKRFLTPFGIIDVTIQTVGDMAKKISHIEIEGDGIAGRWSSLDVSLGVFRKTLLNFVCAIIDQDGHENPSMVDFSLSAGEWENKKGSAGDDKDLPDLSVLSPARMGDAELLDLVVENSKQD